tara:strand:+ start:4151 stop:5143 length:993 start_codon:yes stop_codon:yes gene_type:complete
MTGFYKTRKTLGNRFITMKVIIFGGLGQDGILLTKQLSKDKAKIIITSRNLNNQTKNHLKKVNHRLVKINFTNQSQIADLIKTEQPDQIYFLSGQSSVGKSFKMPVETYKSFTDDLIMVLDSVKKFSPRSKIFNPSSAEVFGNSQFPLTELSEHKPCSPYGLAKSASTEICKYYRDNESLFIVNGYLFNHESLYRPDHFVTKKIINFVKNLKNNLNQKLYLGNVDIIRDWGCAEEYVIGMIKALESDYNEDFIFATGQSNSLRDFLLVAFEYIGKDYLDFIEINKENIRESDIIENHADPTKAKKLLGWETKVSFNDLVKKLMKNNLTLN